MGNGEAKELICMTHGHEQRGKEYWRVGWRAEQRNMKGGRNGRTVIA